MLEIQHRLTELCYYDGQLSGKYLEGTQAAIQAFQEDFELEVTGYADPETQALLFGVVYRPLRYGSSGADVKDMQSRLMSLGYYTGKLSGNYLASTQQAVSDFQSLNDLDASGTADLATL